MSTRKFKLKALLSYRHFLKTQAAGRLAQAAQARLDAYQSLSRCEAKLTEIERLLDPQFISSARASDLLLIQKGIADQRRQIFEATQHYAKAVEDEKASHSEVVGAQKDYEVLLQLEKKHKEAIRLEELKVEERGLSEYTNARFKRIGEA